MNLIAMTIAAFALQLIVGCNRSPSYGASPKGGEPDPLAYTIHKTDGAAVALFDAWENSSSTNDQGTTIRSNPRGRKGEFMLTLYVAPMNDRDQATFLDTAPADFAGHVPGLMPRGGVQTVALGGTDARLMEYDVTGPAVAATMPGAPASGGNRVARAAFVQQGDVAVVAFAAGTEPAMRELGRAVEIAAESVRFTESPIEQAIVGRWYNAGSTSSGRGTGLISLTWERTITFYPDGTFSETDTTIGSASVGGVSGEHAKAGRVVRRGGNMTFHYTDGSVRNSDYVLQGDALQLYGKRWTRQ